MTLASPANDLALAWPSDDLALALLLIFVVPCVSLLVGRRKSNFSDRKAPASLPAIAAVGPPLGGDALLPAIKEIREHVAEDRLLAAGALLDRVKAGMAARPSDPTTSLAAAELGAWSERLAARYATINARLASLTPTTPGDSGSTSWRCVFDRDGTQTFVKRDPQSRLLMVKCESELSGVRLEDFLATARETHLYHTWFPNTQRSETLQAASRLERVFRTVQCVKVPVLGEARYDVLLHCFGCEAIEERGAFVVSGRSPQAEELPDLVFPPPENGKRLPMQSLVMLIEPDLAPKAERLRATLQIGIDESRFMMPGFVVDFIAATVVSRIFAKQKARARDLRSGKAAEHAAAMEADPTFYAQWLPARLEQLRAKGVRTRYTGT